MGFCTTKGQMTAIFFFFCKHNTVLLILVRDFKGAVKFYFLGLKDAGLGYQKQGGVAELTGVIFFFGGDFEFLHCRNGEVEMMKN